MMHCKYCRNWTEYIDRDTLYAYCDESCRYMYTQYNEWKSLSLEIEQEKEEYEESFHDIIMRTGGYPVHCAHRGGGFEFAPENTMVAFKKAVEHGARVLELDLRLTRDMQLVLMHWSTIDETTSGSGEVSEYTLEELRQFDAGFHHPAYRGKGVTIPTLKEFLDTFVPIKDLLFFFDFKDPLALRMTLQFIRPYRIGNRFILGSAVRGTNHLILEKRLGTKIPVSTDVLESIAIITAHLFGSLHRHAFKHDIFSFVLCGATSFLWTRALVEDVHKQGRRVSVSSYGRELNKEERLREAISFGVDFIMTDRPDLLQTLLKNG